MSVRTGISLAALLLVAVLGASCSKGPATKDGGGGGGNLSACDLTEPAVVGEVFGEASTSEVGGAARNCTYPVSEGSATEVNVFYYGNASQWDGIREGYVDNRGGVTDVSGIGDAAFNPNDFGGYEVVVRSGDVVFAVSVFSGDPSDANLHNIAALAKRIANDL